MAETSFIAPDSDIAAATIYQVYPRAFSADGSLRAVTAELERISALGADILYLTPVQPIGRERRIGSVGSPYAIQDYRRIDPEQGTDGDFDELVTRAHALDLRVVLDIVFHHVSPDAVLAQELPDAVMRDVAAEPTGSIPEWGDVAELVFDRAVRAHLLEVLLFWAARGVDGFRCDVASLVPLDFWLDARAVVDAAHPGTLWIAETVDPGMIAFCRRAGITVHEDAEVFQAFDIEYPYDTWQLWRNATDGRASALQYVDLVQWQGLTRPPTAMKLRCVENHDNARVQSFLSTDRAFAWTALTALLPGPFLMYAGQEASAAARPSLFEREPVDWSGVDLSAVLTRLISAKKKTRWLRRFDVLESAPWIGLSWSAIEADEPHTLLGLFDVDGTGGPVPVRIPDGRYTDLLAEAEVVVANGLLHTAAPAVVLDVAALVSWPTRRNPLLIGEVD
ncbi:alpha-amylase family glycosyl hydrolase [Leifsonia poae]|uniref:alpha-amylase family glycosyl hydrolase n=1 Tax=Leifsonia poae TaxID=110933 RepID=UPI001CC02A5E|nr:alpha-amylase family glycosyl hydrolase [Leifsonia poae]